MVLSEDYVEYKNAVQSGLRRRHRRQRDDQFYAGLRGQVIAGVGTAAVSAGREYYRDVRARSGDYGNFFTEFYDSMWPRDEDEKGAYDDEYDDVAGPATEQGGALGQADRAVYNGESGWSSNHITYLSRMPYRGRRRRFKRRRTRRRLYRRRGRLRRTRFRRRFRIKRRSKYPKWFKQATHLQRPINWEYSQGCGITGFTAGLSTVFVPAYDTNNYVDKNALGDGTGTYAQPQLFSAVVDDSDQIARMEAQGAFSASSGEALPAGKVQVYIDKMTWKWNIINETTHGISLRIYWVKPRHDVTYATNAYVAGDNNKLSWGSDWNHVLGKCLDRDLIVTAGNNCLTTLNPGFVLQQSPSFCAMFKVLNVKNYEMKPGGHLMLGHKRKGLFRMSDWIQGTYPNMLGWNKFTRIPIFQIIGWPVIDAANSNYERLGKAKLAIHHTQRTRVWSWNRLVTSNKALNVNAPAGAVANAMDIEQPVAAPVNE